MKNDENLAADEKRRIEQHEAIKGEVREQIHGEITRKAGQAAPAERASTEALAESLKEKAVREVSASETELERGKAFARGSQIVDYVFYLIYGIIGLEAAHS